MNYDQMNPEQDEKQKALAGRIVSRHEKMVAGRSNWESHWQECMEYIVPRKDNINTSKQAGAKHGNELFDSTAIYANQQLAGALHGVLTNPSTRFFELVMGDPKLDDDDEVKEWLQEVGDSMYHVFNNSNFQTEIHEIYLDQGAIGTSCLYIGESDESVLHFAARPIKEIYIDENNLGLIDTVHREFSWKIKQIVQEFGLENLPPQVQKKHMDGCDDPFVIIHAVGPVCKDKCDCCAKEKAKGHKFTSYYILKEEKLILSDGGFHEFPFAVPRWTKTSGEIYGRGPGMDMLPEVKMLNRMREATIVGAQLAVRPPMAVVDDGVIGKVRMTPGGLTIIRAGSEPPKQFMSDTRIDFGYQSVEDVRKHVRAGFYGDLFQLRDGPQMTATEVSTISEQQMRLMGPILGRQHFELLRPTIQRSFGIMSRKGLIPQAPQAIQGKQFDVRYSSLIARAQRLSGIQNLTRAFSAAAPVFQLDQKVVDNVNTDETLKYIWEEHGLPVKLLNNKRVVAESREARAQAQQAAIQQQQEAHMADVAGKTLPGVAQVQQAENSK